LRQRVLRGGQHGLAVCCRMGSASAISLVKKREASVVSRLRSTSVIKFNRGRAFKNWGVETASIGLLGIRLEGGIEEKERGLKRKENTSVYQEDN